jgi:hypothetical protein
MLHMVVNTHLPQDCAFRGKEQEELLVGAFDAFEKLAPDQEISVRGSWVNRSNHEAFMLLDAPNAHVIELALIEAGVIGRSSNRILPVVSTDDAIPEE